MSKRNPVAKAVRRPEFKMRIVAAKVGKGSYKRPSPNKKSYSNYSDED